MMMRQSADFLSTPELNYEQWREVLRPDWGLYTPDDHKAFAGRVRSRSICGFNASDISNNIRRCERTKQDVRLDGVDHWYAVFQIAGRSTIIQNDQAATLAVGDVALIDSARAVTDPVVQLLHQRLIFMIAGDLAAYFIGLSSTNWAHA